MKKYILENVLTIKREELKKFIPMFMIGSLVIFNFIMLRQLKDSIIISTLGARAIPIAKIYYVLPASVVFMLLYSKLSNYLDGKVIFIIFVIFFGVAFLSYSLFFYSRLTPTLGYLFYTLAESWSTVVFGTCMWAFFNDICTIGEAKRFYVLVSGAQVGSIIASGSVNWFVNTFKDHYIEAAMLSVVLSTALIVVLILLNGSVFKVIHDREVKEVEESKKKSYKGIFEGVLLIFRSRYLFLVLLVTLSYNFTTIVTEYIWKSNLEIVYRTKEELFLFLGSVSFWTTIISSVVAIFLTGGVMKYIGFTAALIMFPAVFGLSSSFYFFLYMTPIGGAFQWIVTKISKYALADPAKQMLYIPCTKEERYKSKSVIDILGARGGKALGSLFAKQLLSPILFFKDMAYFSFPFLLVVTTIWLIAALNLGIMFKRRGV